MLRATPHGDIHVPHAHAYPVAPQAARTLPEGPSLLPFVGCRCPEQVLGSRREVTAQAGSCQTGLCVAAIKSGVFVYPACGAENQGSFLGVTRPASPRRGWEPRWGLCLVPATLAVSSPPGLPAKGCEGHRPPPWCWGAGAEAEGILPPPATCAGSRIVPSASCPFLPPSRRVRPRGPQHARSSWAVAASSLPGIGVGAPVDGAGLQGGLGNSPCIVQAPMLCGKTPRGAGEMPIPCTPWGGRANDPWTGHPQGHFGEVSGARPDCGVLVGWLGAAGLGLAPGPGRCCRLPNSPAWLGGRCLFWWRPRPRAGGGAGCGREALRHGGGGKGEPLPRRGLPSAYCMVVPCSLGSRVPQGAAQDLARPSQH